MNPRRVVYTSIFGDYDVLRPVDASWKCDFVCFTDNPETRASGWRVVVVDDRSLTPADLNRRYKLLPHVYLSGYEMSLYIDGNITLHADPALLFDKYSNSLIAAPTHRDRNCAYAEAKTCLDLEMIDEATYERLLVAYKSIQLPVGFGLTENGVLIRRHNHITVSTLMDEWWAEYCKCGKRDQILLPMLLWKNDVHVTPIVEGPRYTDRFFRINLHALDEKKNLLRRCVRIAHIRRHLGIHYRIFHWVSHMTASLMRRNKAV
jgi:hypothetical protein